MLKKIFLLLLICGACESNHKPEAMETPQPEPYTPTYTPDFLMGKFEPKTHPDFIEIEAEYADRAGRYMHKSAYKSFVAMAEKAKEDEVTLKIISAVRNFDYQKGIWERKWNGNTLLEGKTNAQSIEDPPERAKAILRYSSMPGTSRHHWGTDIDINALNNEYFDKGRGKKEFDWLQANAAEFGFCRSYTEKSEAERKSGYEEEKWHWSYTPLSKVMLKDAELLLKDSMITGFEGSETAEGLSVVQNYILGVDITCF